MGDPVLELGAKISRATRRGNEGHDVILDSIDRSSQRRFRPCASNIDGARGSAPGRSAALATCACFSPRTSCSTFTSSEVARIVDPHVHQEPVHLRLGQRIGALPLDRVLRRQHHEERRQPVALAPRR